MWVCMHLWMFLYMYGCVYVSWCVCVVCAFLWMYIYGCLCIEVYMCVCRGVYWCMFVYVCIFMCTCGCVYMYACVTVCLYVSLCVRVFMYLGWYFSYIGMYVYELCHEYRDLTQPGHILRELWSHFQCIPLHDFPSPRAQKQILAD